MDYSDFDETSWYNYQNDKIVDGVNGQIVEMPDDRVIVIDQEGNVIEDSGYNEVVLNTDGTVNVDLTLSHGNYFDVSFLDFMFVGSAVLLCFAIALMFWFKPHIPWTLTSKWESYGAQEPSDLYIIGAKIGAVAWFIAGVSVLALFLLNS